MEDPKEAKDPQGPKEGEGGGKEKKKGKKGEKGEKEKKRETVKYKVGLGRYFNKLLGRVKYIHTYFNK